MSPQDMNRSTNLSSRESAENATPIGDESRQGAAADATRDGREPGSSLGLAITAVVLGLLSFALGLWLFSSSKTAATADQSRLFFASETGAPANGNAPATQNSVEPLAEPRETEPKPEPEPDPERL